MRGVDKKIGGGTIFRFLSRELMRYYMINIKKHIKLGLSILIALNGLCQTSMAYDWIGYLNSIDSDGDLSFKDDSTKVVKDTIFTYNGEKYYIPSSDQKIKYTVTKEERIGLGFKKKIVTVRKIGNKEVGITGGDDTTGTFILKKNQVYKVSTSKPYTIPADGSTEYDNSKNVNGSVSISRVNNDFLSGGLGGESYTAGSDITISDDNVISAKKTGKVASGDSGIITGGSVYNAIQDVKSNIKNYKAGSDITISDANSISVNKDGLIEKANSGIVTGGTVFAVTNKLSNTLDTQKTQLSSATKRIGSLATTVSDLKDTIIDINTSVTTAITSSSATINGRLDTNLSNLTADGQDTLRQYIRDEIKSVAKENMSKTKVGTQEMSNEAVMPNGDTLADKADKADLDNLSKIVDSKANTSDVNAALDKKADKDNVYTKTEVDNKFTSVSNELENKVNKSDFNTVKDQVDKNTTDIAKKADLAYVDSALSTKADKSEVNALERKVDTKADKTALDALSKTVDQKADLAYVDNELSKKANLADFNQLKDTVSSNTDKITANSEKIATNTKDIEGLKETKADADGSNIDVSKFSEKLGVGKIEKDNAGLVTGGVVADALAYKADYGYVNAGFNALEGQMQQMNQSLTKNINQVGAGAAALAGLHPQEYDPNCKLDFAAGYGHYKNANATALGMYYRPNAGTTISLAGTIGNGAPMLSAGVSFKIGYGKNVEKVIVKKADYDELQNKVASQDEKLEQQDERIKQLEEMVKSMAS